MYKQQNNLTEEKKVEEVRIGEGRIGHYRVRGYRVRLTESVKTNYNDNAEFELPKVNYYI